MEMTDKKARKLQNKRLHKKICNMDEQSFQDSMDCREPYEGNTKANIKVILLTLQNIQYKKKLSKIFKEERKLSTKCPEHE